MVENVDRFVEKDNVYFTDASYVEEDDTEKIKNYIFEPEDKYIKSLRLQIIGNETLSMSSEITDNYVESNVALQDHISMKPIIYTIEGEVGELVWFSRELSNDLLDELSNKLLEIPSYSPDFSKTEQKERKKAQKIMDVVDNMDDFSTRVWNFLDKDENDTEQKKVYKYLLVLWKERTPICIKTAWSKLSNFVIQNIEISQSDRTVDKSKIKISFKEFRTVKRKIVEFDESKFMGRASAQSAKKVDKGTTTGNTATIKEAKPKQFYPTETGKANLGKLGLSV